MARVAEYLTFRAANMVIATNESYRQVALTRGKVREDQVFVVRNGPKISEFVPVAPDFSLKRGFPFMVCFVGVMGDEDGIVDFIETIQFIVYDLGRRDILFTLIGDGSCRLQALAKANVLDLNSFVSLPGMIRDDLLLRRYLCTADVLVSPEPLTPHNVHSTFMKIAEYMAMGRPIVASDLPESRHTAQCAAWYAEPGNYKEFGQMIVTLLGDSKRRQEMGESGRRRVLSELGWEHQERLLFRAYESAMGTADMATDDGPMPG